MSSIFIFGAGGHSRVVADTALLNGFSTIFFVEENQYFTSSQNTISEEVFYKKFSDKRVDVCLGIGFNFLRAKIASSLRHTCKGVRFPTLVHPNASVARSSIIQQGSVIFSGGCVGPASIIGAHSVVNHNASVDHDCCLSDFVSIGPGARLGGNVRIGARSYVAIGATVVDGLNIGSDVLVGAGALVLGDVEDCSISFGTPAKFIRKRPIDENYLKKND
ncbi:MAG: acetyltransferase [Betaproteobacteria bacterium]|nr:acetyltransferase [Betaproteobacteria bacterium]